MYKIGNDKSQILNEMLKTAQKKAESTARVPQGWSEILKNPVKKQASLRDILAQLGGPPTDDMSAPLGAGEEGLSGEADMSLPDAQPTGECPQEVKQSLVDALLAACGSIEQAHTCLDELGGGMPTEGVGEPPLDSEPLPPETPAEPPAPMPMM